MSLRTILLVLLVVFIFGPFMGPSTWGYARWSPAGVIVVILIFMLLTGRL
jgi:hypothetical protein